MNLSCRSFVFLSLFTSSEIHAIARSTRKLRQSARRHVSTAISSSTSSTSVPTIPLTPLLEPEVLPTSRLNPTPDDYSVTPFVDKTILTIQAGNGGNGCISFLREKYIPYGPANGGDGGYGGNIFIQAVRNCSSLNVISKARVQRAGDGEHGMGKNRGGKQGKDVLLQVPVGTVIREVRRWDPVTELERLERLATKAKRFPDRALEAQQELAKRWALYPGLSPKQRTSFTDFPPLPAVRRAPLSALQPMMPIALDLSQHMPIPRLLAAGALGGMGNPHFASQDEGRPKVATRGYNGVRIGLVLELKLVADVGLVGLPNAGKSTLLRSMSASRARVGSWAFTTLVPNIGTVVLDDYKARSIILDGLRNDGGKTRVTIADIPGLIEDAHLNKGLGLEFLKHVERAKVLAFVVDLSAGDAVEQLVSLWKEVGAYQELKDKEELDYENSRLAKDPFNRGVAMVHQEEFESINLEDVSHLPPLRLPPVTGKPWFVVATKADKQGTQDNFSKLRHYVQQVADGKLRHPSGDQSSFREGACAVPISAIKGEGMGNTINVVLDLVKKT